MATLHCATVHTEALRRLSHGLTESWQNLSIFEVLKV